MAAGNGARTAVTVERTPVLIAGGGPAGLAAAAELAHQGVDCVVIEPRTQVSHRRPRAKTTSVRTMEHLRRWGVAGALRAAAPLPVAWSQRVMFCATLSGHAVTAFDGAFGLTTGRDDRFPESGQQVPQPVVEEVLRAHVRRSAHVDLRLGHAVTGLTQDAAGVAVTVRDGKCVSAGDLANGVETLAGSVLTMDRAVVNLQHYTGASLTTAVRLASRNPARMLGLDQLGAVAVGQPANFNLFSADGTLQRTILHGRAVETARP